MHNLLHKHEGLSPNPNEEHSLVDEEDRQTACMALDTIAVHGDEYDVKGLRNIARKAKGMPLLK